MIYIFPVEPIGKPRMTRSDSWKGRDCVQKYWAFKKEMNLHAKKLKFEMPEKLMIEFHVSIPESWSKKKKEKMLRQPHQQKPDIDNFVKALFDSLCENDSFIYEIHAKKLWDYLGCIIVEDFK